MIPGYEVLDTRPAHQPYRQLTHVARCACHGWPWFECDALVPHVWLELVVWGTDFGRIYACTRPERNLSHLEGVLA